MLRYLSARNVQGPRRRDGMGGEWARERAAIDIGVRGVSDGGGGDGLLAPASQSARRRAARRISRGGCGAAGGGPLSSLCRGALPCPHRRAESADVACAGHFRDPVLAGTALGGAKQHGPARRAGGCLLTPGVSPRVVRHASSPAVWTHAPPAARRATARARVRAPQVVGLLRRRLRGGRRQGPEHLGRLHRLGVAALEAALPAAVEDARIRRARAFAHAALGATARAGRRRWPIHVLRRPASRARSGSSNGRVMGSHVASQGACQRGAAGRAPPSKEWNRPLRRTRTAASASRAAGIRLGIRCPRGRPAAWWGSCPYAPGGRAGGRGPGRAGYAQFYAQRTRISGVRAGRERGRRLLWRLGSGGQRIRTSTGLRPAVFKTAALPVRSSPPVLQGFNLRGRETS